VQVLIVKTSSMGDVVHALPALSDMRAHVPRLQVDWLVEAPFAAIPALHPGVRRVLPLAWRKWRKRLGERDTWRVLGEFRRELRRERYDLVLDLQGLVKSALWAALARGPSAGYDVASARERPAGLLYRRTAAVPRHDRIQAVERCRRLAAAHLGYAMPATPPDFGIAPPPAQWQVPGRYAVLIPAASRPEKLWPEADWIALGQRLHAEGSTPVVLWGSEAERERAERIAAGCGGVVPPFLTVQDSAAVLGRAERIVGLDTGFTHLGAAFGRPTVGIYCDHEPGLAGITGPGPVASIGGKGQRPSREAVLALLEAQSSSMRTGG
jgi:heptosyltransferase-1